ncbi:MAG: protein kinase [Planctomycetes bacterium]|nr:protein kinase [Planctomycetota bacterium]
MTSDATGDAGTRDEELLADLFDSMLQEILDGRTPDLEAVQRDRPDLRDRIAKTWQLACSVAGRREPSRPVLGGYEIVRELGHGGMGTVYLARHQSLQRDVAIKVLPHSLAMSPRAKQRFLEEARALARIRHENVVHIHRIIDHAEMLAFEMEFVDGPSLQSAIVQLRQKAKPFAMASLAETLGHEPSPGVRSSVEWFVRLGIRIARALGEVHRHGLVHRDVKPSNILLRGDGTPVLADFGLALQGDLEATRTKFAGTPVYAAPERLRGGDGQIDARTDVYSLGVTLYEALTCNPPFTGSSTHEVLRRIEAGAVPGLRQRAPHVSRDLATVVGKAMEPDPRHRYATADEFADDLERLLSLQPIHARPAGPLRRAFQFVRRHQRVVGAALASAVLAAAVIWPLAAHANARNDAEARAAQHLHAARSRLLAPEVLPAPWTGRSPLGRTLQHDRAQTLRQVAFAEALAGYDAAVALQPDDRGLRLERDAVRAAGSIGTDGGEEPLQVDAPVLGQMLANTRNLRRLSDGVLPQLAAASPADRSAAGLFAFLLGDHATSTACWSTMPEPQRADPLLDACAALQVTAEGAPERAYPRLFHAARSFPQSRAIGFALADAALATGDADLARQWITGLPPGDVREPDARRELLAADLVTAEGRFDEARQLYRRLADADATDPTPLLRLANLSMRTGERSLGERLLHHVLQRWPGVAAARLQLARMALQSRKLPEYLAHCRHALGQLRTGTSSTHADLCGILRLGGLHSLTTDGTAGTTFVATARQDDGIPLGAWLKSSQVAGIEQATRLLVLVDETASKVATLDQRPLGVALRTTWTMLLRAPQITSRLPYSLQAGLLVALPPLLGPATDRLAAELLPYQTILGTRLHTIADRRLFQVEMPEGIAVYGNQIVRSADLDGDTLEDICFSLPPLVAGPASGAVEIRSTDGELVRTWPGSDDNLMFARGIAAVGDVDGDLCDDIVIGCPLRVDAPSAKAVVELRSGRTGAVLWSIADACPSFGVAVCGLGDVDGDGIGDIAVGSSAMRLGHDDRGRAVVLSGRSGTRLRELLPDRGGTWFGGAVAAAGDVTGDGIGDVLVGGNFGNAPGLAAVFDATTGKLVTSFAEDDPEQMFGASIASAGDIDGDGIAEVLVAAPAIGAQRLPGRVLVLSCRTGRSLYELTGERPREGFGAVFCRLHRWRKDGRPAIAVATRQGGPIGNGYIRVFDLAKATPLQTFAGHQAHRMFCYALCELGDRDGDGLIELGSLSLRGDHAEFWRFSFADADPRSALGNRPR